MFAISGKAAAVLVAAMVSVLGSAAVISHAPATKPGTIRMSAAADAVVCPNNGRVRFGVEPYGPAQEIMRVYTSIANLIGDRLGCDVELFVVHSYNAEIEAMRSGRLEFGQFGPLGYVIANQLAGAEAVSSFADASGGPASYYTTIIVRADSGLSTLQDLVGRSIAYQDPVSTSGHLLPAHGLREHGIDPATSVRGLFTGSPAASLEALRHSKVDAAAISSIEITAAQRRGHYDPSEYRVLWTSEIIPTDPIAVSASLEPAFRERLIQVLSSLDLRELPEEDQEFLIAYSKPGLRLVPQHDAAFDPIRELLPTLEAQR